MPFDLRLCARSYDDLAAPNLRGRAGVFPCRRTAKNLLKMPLTFWPCPPDPNGPVSPGARALYEQLDKALTGSAKKFWKFATRRKNSTFEIHRSLCAGLTAPARLCSAHTGSWKPCPASAAATGERARRYKAQFGFRLLFA